MIGALFSQVRRVGAATAWSLVAAASSFAGGVTVARTLGPEGRGIVAIAVTVAGLVSLLACFGTGTAYRTLLPKGVVNLGGYKRLTVGLALASIPLLGVVSLILGGSVDAGFATNGLLLSFVIYGLSNVVWSNAKEGLHATGRITYSAFVGAVGSLAFLVLAVVVLVVWRGSVLVVLAAYTAMNLLQAALASLDLNRGAPTERPKGAAQLLRASPPYLSYYFGQEAAMRFDRPLIGLLSTTTQVGYFTVGSAIAEVLRIPVLSAGQFVLFDAANGKFNHWMVLKHTLLWTALTGIAALILFVPAPWIITVLYGDAYAASVGPFRVLLLAQILLVPFLIVSRALVGRGDRWLAGIPGMLGTLALTAASIVLVPQGGATGAAWALAVTFLTMSASSVVLLMLRGGTELGVSPAMSTGPG